MLLTVWERLAHEFVCCASSNTGGSMLISGKAWAAGVLTVLTALTAWTRLGAQTPATITLQERVMMTSQIYHVISTFFPGLSQDKFDTDYQRYLGTILPSEDRRQFDLASMELVAGLNDGHSWFYDKWLDQTHGQAIGLLAYPLAGRWAVVRSQLGSVRVGDVITAIDGTPMDTFFDRNRRFVSASSSRDAGVSFFDTPVVFPERFTLTLDDGRLVHIDRKNDKKASPPPPQTEGRWLVDKSVAYIRVPSFHGIETQVRALEYLKRYRDAKTVILDVRGNPGMGEPFVLQSSLMGRPYQTWTQSSSQHGGALLRNYASGYPEHLAVTTTDTTIRPRETAYSGALILLTDRICSCACEDFVMPFKYSKRAILVGETTAGTFSFTRHIDFANGMILNISAVRHTFPDGSQFEGVGITPDVLVKTTAEDLRADRDPVLDKALEIAKQPAK
jgi:carboxyl-terminal processing protease